MPISPATSPAHAASAQARRRRLPALVAAILAVTFSGVALVVLPATSAHAQCPIKDPDCGGPTDTTFTSTLTVNNQNVGTVASAPAGITCPDDCTQSDQQTVPGDIRPTSGWPVYTLTAAGGPAGTTPSWVGCDSVNASHQCIVTNDTASKQVAVGWFDETDPMVALTNPADGATVGRTVTATATATDGAGIKEVRFQINNVTEATDTTAPYSATLDLSGYPSGSTIVVTAQAVDDNGRASQMHHAVTVDTSTRVSLGDLPSLVSTRSPLNVPVTTDSDASTVCTTIDTATHAPIAGSSLADPCDGTYAIPFTPQTADGSYEIRAAATDGVGNTAVATKDVVVDNTAPAVAITQAPAEGSTIAPGSALVSFSAEDAHPGTVTCTYDQAGIPCAADRTATVSVTTGAHVFTVEATDAVGNHTALSVHFTGASTDPADPGDPGTPTDPGDPGTPTDPGDPGTPTDPGDPGTTTPVHHTTRTATKVTARAAHRSIRRHHRMRLVATVRPHAATGRVVFTRGRHTLCIARVHDGRATCRTKKLGHGKIHVIAHYLGSRAYLPSQARFTFRVR